VESSRVGVRANLAGFSLEQQLNRIETFTDLSRFAALREHAGAIQVGHDGIVILATETDETGATVRSWFVLIEPRRDGESLPKTCPAHTIVGTDLRPGEPTPPPVPREALGLACEELMRLRKEQIDNHAERERHVIHCQQVLADRQQLVEQASRIEQLESELLLADARNRDFGERVADLNKQLTQSRSDLESLRREKSLSHRVKEWGRQWFQR
jgi:hypothetical protein